MVQARAKLSGENFSLRVGFDLFFTGLTELMVHSEPLTAVAQLDDQSDHDGHCCRAERNAKQKLALLFFLRGLARQGTLVGYGSLCLCDGCYCVRWMGSEGVGLVSSFG